SGPAAGSNGGAAIERSGPAGGGGGGGGGGAGGVTITSQRFVPDEILVRVSTGTSPATIVNFARSQLLAPLGTPPLPLVTATVDRSRTTDRRWGPAVLDVVRGDRRLAAVQPNYLYELRAAGPPDDGAPGQYAGSKMHLGQAHALARGTGVVIALI